MRRANLCLQANHQLVLALDLTSCVPMPFFICDDDTSLVLNLYILLSYFKVVKVDEKNEEEVKALRTSTPVIDGSDGKHA